MTPSAFEILRAIWTLRATLDGHTVGSHVGGLTDLASLEQRALWAWADDTEAALSARSGGAIWRLMALPEAPPMTCYVVLSPDRIRGIYDTWPACEAAVRGVAGAVYRKAADRRLAEQLLRGESRRLEPGQYAFVDGNHLGGIGIVLMYRRRDGSSITVEEVYGALAELAPTLAPHLARLRNAITEMAAAYVALGTVPEGSTVTVVHDWSGTGPLIDGRWKGHDPVMREAAAACRERIAARSLTVVFQHTNGHQSSAGGDEYAQYNARADALATEAAARLAEMRHEWREEDGPQPEEP